MKDRFLISRQQQEVCGLEHPSTCLYFLVINSNISSSLKLSAMYIAAVKRRQSIGASLPVNKLLLQPDCATHRSHSWPLPVASWR